MTDCSYVVDERIANARCEKLFCFVVDVVDGVVAKEDKHTRKVEHHADYGGLPLGTRHSSSRQTLRLARLDVIWLTLCLVLLVCK